MRNVKKTTIVRYVSVFISILGFAVLIIDDLIKPFLTNYPEVKLIIILLSVISAYHTFLTFSIQSIVREELEKTNTTISGIDHKIKLMKDSIPYSALDDIEYRHGHNNKSENCEMWIIANMLQESKNDDSVLLTIYENITKNSIHYYYILPGTEKSKYEIAGLQSRLSNMHKNKRSKINGGLSYRYDDQLLNIIASDYFDIILYVDCDSNWNPYIIGDSATCEGYQCFSRYSQENDYYYQPIDTDKILQMRDYHRAMEFIPMDIGG